MANFFNTPLFGLTLSVLAYTLGLLLYRRFPNPLTTPLLVSTALIIVILHYTGISYRDYYVGGSYLNSLIIPSTVALAVPFYKNLHLMRHHYKSILIGSTVACILNTTYTALIAKLFGMDYFLAISLFPKSVTTAMAVGISEKMQGITTVTLVVVVITGILTSVLGPVSSCYWSFPRRNWACRWYWNCLQIWSGCRCHGWSINRCNRDFICLY